MIFRSSMIVPRKNSVPLHLISFNSVQQYGKSRLHLYRHQWRRVCRRQGLDAAIRLCSGDRGTVRTRELRPMWKQLISSLERGDELVVSRFSNALRGTRELATFIEYCRVKVVRIISIQDRIDTFDELFPDTKPHRSSVCSGHSLRSVPCCARHRHTSSICNRISGRPRSRKGTVETGA